MIHFIKTWVPKNTVKLPEYKKESPETILGYMDRLDKIIHYYSNKFKEAFRRITNVDLTSVRDRKSKILLKMGRSIT